PFVLLTPHPPTGASDYPSPWAQPLSAVAHPTEGLLPESPPGSSGSERAPTIAPVPLDAPADEVVHALTRVARGSPLARPSLKVPGAAVARPAARGYGDAQAPSPHETVQASAPEVGPAKLSPALGQGDDGARLPAPPLPGTLPSPAANAPAAPVAGAPADPALLLPPAPAAAGGEAVDQRFAPPPGVAGSAPEGVTTGLPGSGGKSPGPRRRRRQAGSRALPPNGWPTTAEQVDRLEGRREVEGGAHQLTALRTIAIAGGPGSPGCTTVAINLAAALGTVAPTVCVDTSHAPSVAAYLDADPTRNLYMLAHADPGTPREWDRALEQELQPMDKRSPHGLVLAGVPKLEMWGGVTGDFTTRLLAELRQRYRYVVVDAGSQPAGAEQGVWGAALSESDQALFVVAADLVGVWRARTALGHLLGRERPFGGSGLPSLGVALVVNRHDRRRHHRRSEVEWALGLPAAAVVPFDHGGTERAIAAQRPAVLNGRSRAGQALLELAGRVGGGRVVLPPEPVDETRAGRDRTAVGAALWATGRKRIAAGVARVAAYVTPANATATWSRWRGQRTTPATSDEAHDPGPPDTEASDRERALALPGREATVRGVSGG
ncbi:MAG: hypothetical protein M3442_15135, partial [Chloroflexota bacterium]|nr:hypothetical protein [Chloroflexota bacterium]